jgi:hypothetical protein
VTVDAEPVGPVTPMSPVLAKSRTMPEPGVSPEILPEIYATGIL